MMSYPIQPTYYIKMDLWQYFGKVSEFPEITGLLRFYPLSVIKLAKRYFYSMKHLFICKILLVKYSVILDARYLLFQNQHTVLHIRRLKMFLAQGDFHFHA